MRLLFVLLVFLLLGLAGAGLAVLGALAGFALTGVQSVSRSMVGLLSPEGKSAEFYGFFAVTGRTSSFIGPTVYGWLAAAAAGWYEAMGHSAVIAEQMGLRVALLSIVVFLLVGLAVLFTVKNTKTDKSSAS